VERLLCNGGRLGDCGALGDDSALGAAKFAVDILNFPGIAIEILEFRFAFTSPLKPSLLVILSLLGVFESLLSPHSAEAMACCSSESI
jgi:hypothetical protein